MTSTWVRPPRETRDQNSPIADQRPENRRPRTSTSHTANHIFSFNCSSNLDCSFSGIDSNASIREVALGDLRKDE